jgi:hypothetical protein
MDKPWNWYNITERTDINVILENLELPWDLRCVYIKLIYNKHSQFEKDEEIIRKYIMAKRIWRQWFQSINNPNYALCRKRLLREFDGLVKI